MSSSSDYLQLPALWRGTESHSGGGESFSPSELLVFPSSCPEPLGRNFANTDGLLSINLLFGPIKTQEEKSKSMDSKLNSFLCTPDLELSPQEGLQTTK